MSCLKFGPWCWQNGNEGAQEKRGRKKARGRKRISQRQRDGGWRGWGNRPGWWQMKIAFLAYFPRFSSPPFASFLFDISTTEREWARDGPRARLRRWHRRRLAFPFSTWSMPTLTLFICFFLILAFLKNIIACAMGIRFDIGIGVSIRQKSWPW